MKYIKLTAVFLFLGLAALLFLRVTATPVLAQGIITADRFLAMVSERYAEIRDYEARVVIRSGTTDMTGNLSYLSPFFLRIDFTSPPGQVLVFNGSLLSIHIPDLRAVLTQHVSPARRTATPGGGAGLASAQGLQLLQRGYVATFVTGPEPVPLDGTGEMVVQLRLTRRLAAEGFREIILSINPNTMLIRRIEGRTIADALVRFDFHDVRTNLGIPEQRFVFDPPGTANIFNNFMFQEAH